MAVLEWITEICYKLNLTKVNLAIIITVRLEAVVLNFRACLENFHKFPKKKNIARKILGLAKTDRVNLIG